MGSESNIDGCFLIRALYRGGFGNNELHYYLTNLVTGERVEVCRGQAVTDYLKVCTDLKPCNLTWKVLQ